MTKRQRSWVGLAVLGAFALLGMLWSAFGPDKIVLTTAQLQERVNRALPREFKGVTLSHALRAVVSARGAPRYDSESGEIFFDAEDVKVTDFALAGGNLGERLDRLPSAIRDRVEAAAGTAVAAGLRTYLAARPIYRFKDDFKGTILKAAISDVATQDDAIVIAVSLLKFTLMVAANLAVLVVIVFLVVLLVRHPSWGLRSPI